MKSFVASPGRILLLVPLLVCVTEGKFDVHTFVPEALRKAKQGLDVVLRKSPPPAPMIPQRTGHAAIDQALFQTLQWGNSLKLSLSQQCAVMFSMPTLTRVVCTATPTAMLLLVAHSLFQFFQSNLRPLFSSSERVVPKEPTDVAKTVAWTAAVGVWMYQLQTLFRTHPAFVLGEAILFSSASILWKKIRVSTDAVTSTITDELEMTNDIPVGSIITMDVIVPDNETSLSTVDEDVSTVEPPLESPEEVEERLLQVNVTKISAVLDRFESKILSLVGGTRFAAASKHTEADEEDESAEPVVTATEVAESELEAPQVDIEMTQFAEDDLVEVLYDSEDEMEDSDLEHEASAEIKTAPLELPQFVTSLSPYEIMTKSKSFPQLNLATKSILTTATLIGIVSSQVSVFQSIPPMVRHSLVAVAALCLLGLLVHELYQVWMNNSPSIGTFDSLLQQVESSASLFSENMDPLIVELARRPHLRFFRTRIPILDAVAGIAKRIASSSTSTLDEANVESEAEEDTPVEIDTSTQCSHSNDHETPRTVRTNIVAPIFRRWVTPRTTPKVTCTSIVGL
jgi:hypothetical protein